MRWALELEMNMEKKILEKIWIKNSSSDWTEAEGRVFSTAPYFQVQNMNQKCEPWLPPLCFTPMLVSFTSFSPPSTGSGEQAEQPASPSRLWMARWALHWKSSLAPLQTFALEPQRHRSKKQSSLVGSRIPTIMTYNLDGAIYVVLFNTVILFSRWMS